MTKKLDKRTGGALMISAAVAAVVPAAILGAVVRGNRADMATAAPVQIVSVGSVAPDFTLPTQDARTMHLADYKGRAVFLAFVPDWSSADTAKEVKSLAKTENDFDMAGAKVMLVSADSTSAAQKLDDSRKLPFPLLYDDGGKLARRFGVVPGMRRTYVISPVGKVKYRVDSSVIDVDHHGQQLLDVSKCCVDEIAAARADGIGKPIGDYSLPRADVADHAMATLYADGAQKATVALFISAKCPCSNTYNERIEAMAKAFAARGVRFVGIYANADETMDEIAAHAKSKGFDFPILKDENGLGASQFGAGVTPEAYVIDAGHTLRYSGRIDDSRDIGDVQHHDLHDAIEAVLDGKQPPAATRAFGCAIVKKAG